MVHTICYIAGFFFRIHISLERLDHESAGRSPDRSSVMVDSTTSILTTVKTLLRYSGSIPTRISLAQNVVVVHDGTVIFQN